MESIGLEGVFKTEAFASGLNKYTSGLTKAVSDTTAAGGAIGNAIGTGVRVGAEALAGLAIAAVTAAAAVGTAILTIAVNAGKASHELEILSAKTNLSTTALQEWAYAGQFLGVTADDIATYFFRLSRAAYAASNGTKASVDAFKQLGVSVYDAKGKLKDTNTLFSQVITALGKIKDPTLQDALAMAVFGRSAQDLFPLIKAGAGELDNLRQAAHNVGAVLSEEDVAAFAMFDDTLDIIKSSITGLSRSFVAQFLPALQDITGGIVAALVAINQGDLGTAASSFMAPIFKWLGTITKNIPQFVGKFQLGLSKLSLMIRTYLPSIVKLGASLIAALIKGMGPALASLGYEAIQIGKALIQALQANWPAIREAGASLMQDLGDGLTAALGLIHLPSLNDLLTGIFGKAADLSGQFKTWVAGIDWGQLSRNVADAINGIDWAGLGGNLGTTAKNIGSALIDLVSRIDWIAVGVALGTAFDNAVIGALHFGLNIGDVTNLADFQTEWSNIGTQYGQVAGEGMAGVFWKELWKAVFADIFGLSWSDAMAGLKANFAQIGTSFLENWNNLVETPFIQNMELSAAKVVLSVQNWFTNIVNAWILGWDTFIGKINTALGAIGANQIPLIPFMPAPTLGGNQGGGIGTGGYEPPSQPIPPVTTPGTGGGGGGRGPVAGAQTINVTVNNPTAEPASTSVSMTLTKLNYLGVV